MSRKRKNKAYYVIGETDDINKYYDLKDKIGQDGQFGYAVRAVHKKTGEERAIKVISKIRFVRSAEDRNFHFKSLRAEIEVMRKMDHPNIIKFYECFENKSHLYLVMELCKGGELFDRIQEAGSFSEKQAALYLRQISEGVAYMHEKKIAHCDLKPDNFLFLGPEDNSPLKIIDFGMSKFVKRQKYFKSLCGTPYYVAPEVLKGKYNEHADMWSVGVVMFVMLFGYPPFYDPKNDDNKIFQKILRGFKPITKKNYGAHFPEAIPCSNSAKDLIAKLLTLNVAERLTAMEALEHPWMKGLTASESPIAPAVIHNLSKFTASTNMKEAVCKMMVDTLTQDEVEELRKSFKAMDIDGDGSVSMEELEKALMSASSTQNLTKEQIADMMKAADVDGDGSLSYEELLLTAVNRKLISKEERLYETFCKLDLDKNGSISYDEIVSVLGPDQAKAILAEADVDGNGEIDYEEFLSVWLGSEQDQLK